MLNAAQRLYQSFFEGLNGPPKDYRAGHANRGTPPRLHDNITTDDEGNRLSRGERKLAARRRAFPEAL